MRQLQHSPAPADESLRGRHIAREGGPTTTNSTVQRRHTYANICVVGLKLPLGLSPRCLEELLPAEPIARWSQILSSKLLRRFARIWIHQQTINDTLATCRRRRQTSFSFCLFAQVFRRFGEVKRLVT